MLFLNRRQNYLKKFNSFPIKFLKTFQKFWNDKVTLENSQEIKILKILNEPKNLDKSKKFSSKMSSKGAFEKHQKYQNSQMLKISNKNLFTTCFNRTKGYRIFTKLNRWKFENPITQHITVQQSFKYKDHM